MSRLIVFSAPSGCGKDTVVRELNKNDDFTYSISMTSRSKRPGEISGKDYYFVTTEVFKQMIKNNEFAEYQEVYAGIFYGTTKKELNGRLAGDKDVLMILDVNGALNIKKIYGDKAILIFILPPSIGDLEQRLRKRGTETDSEIEKRLERAQYEIYKGESFDYRIINENVNDCVNEIKKIIGYGFRNR